MPWQNLTFFAAVHEVGQKPRWGKSCDTVHLWNVALSGKVALHHYHTLSPGPGITMDI